MPTDQINRMNNNTNPLKKYPSKDPSDNYNAEASGGFDDNCFNKGRMFNPFPDYMITESSNQRLLKAKDNVIEAEGQVPDIGNQFAPDEKPTTALIELKSTEDLIKEFFSTWPQSINLQGIPTAPHDVKDMGPKGAYDPASNFSLTFAVENIVEPNRQSILSGVTHPVQKKFKKYRNDVMNRDQINEEVFDKDKKDVKVGLSASKWTDGILESLRYVHYPNFHMKAIIPSFEERQRKVLSLLQTYKSIGPETKVEAYNSPRDNIHYVSVYLT